MDEWPKTALDFERRFGTEEACLQYLEQLRWPSGFRCPRCGGDKAWRATRGLRVCRLCGYQASVTAGTIFQDTRKPPVILPLERLCQLLAGLSAGGVAKQDANLPDVLPVSV